MTLADQYYLKAMDDYPYDLEMSTENLNYALSYDPEHVGANYLKGLLYMEQFNNYEMAESCFQAALANDPAHLKACLSYSLLAIYTREYSKAKKLLQHLVKLKGVNLSEAYHTWALLCEYQKQYIDAKGWILKAMEETFDNEQMTFLEDEMERINNKISRGNAFKYIY